MAKYSYFLGQSGGSGGSGDFALIKIEYPAGQLITVTFNGETIEAPDTSGLWMYGCEETGTYTIAITGTTAETTVEITTQGQIENVWISPQVINYALIYHLGNEFANPSADELKYSIPTNGWSAVQSGSQSGSPLYLWQTNNSINTEGFSQAFIFGQAYNPVSRNPLVMGTDKVSDSGAGLNNIIIRRDLDKAFGTGVVTSFNKQICYSNLGYRRTYSRERNNLLLEYIGTGTRLFATGFLKTDDLSGLSDYGSDIATILSNAIDLFTDTTALNWMCLNCTGDFMISALSNTNFVNAMNTSPNKSILVANEHWNRFIALLSV